MKTRTLIIIAVFLVLIPWIHALDYDPYNGIRVDGITISATVVMTLTITFSFISWLLLSWASKNIKAAGIPLSIITGASLILPFMGVLGPMAAIIVGVVAGFVAFMLQKKITDPTQNKSLKIATITVAASYFVLIMLVLAAQTNVIWDTGNGIGAWTGTPEGMERVYAPLGGIDMDSQPFDISKALVDAKQKQIPQVPFCDETYSGEAHSGDTCILREVWETKYIGGGSIDLDPDLSPSYAYEFIWNPLFNPLFAIIGIIASSFVVTYVIVKWKMKPTKPYLALVLAGWLLEYGIDNLYKALLNWEFAYYLIETGHKYMIILLLTMYVVPISVLLIAGVLLYRSSLIRKWLKR